MSPLKIKAISNIPAITINTPIVRRKLALSISLYLSPFSFTIETSRLDIGARIYNNFPVEAHGDFPIFYAADRKEPFFEKECQNIIEAVREKVAMFDRKEEKA